ncbi:MULTISPECIES: N-acetylneuraminate synthase [Leptospira]|uniref:N-acetylneuraminate synthase n=1 Tax=Leptospira interrogans serovar Bataviae TaxID=312175 RepID=A0AAP9WID9_LEPIR|nr:MULTISPECIES: N-acetylneuraminate synthase [Leptospira]EMN72561.1 N-acetylneuraminate synthase [Leptospira interrogans serovar Bataviae str. UI 08561]EKP04877.1 N-acetylneuraminate synthase [Leptospira kirschneri str. 2008720114]EKR25168.1 N-acetylneuraminate synthase [Leptospira interrogans serovar Bataviae str. L1111]MCR8648944.1 N-acetylneuraminate synthase [Leptospira interrogans serovar Bataviae]OAM73295.1 N-acetylneuraminate synthase [Leptospira interrogans serovar Bataviae]
MKTLIIAEAGVNHNGDLELARKLIDVAANAGADIVKFQTFEAERLVTKSAKKADYQNTIHDNTTESQYEMLKKLELSKENHEKLIQHCKQTGIEFLSTAFDLQSLAFLEQLNLSRYKIPSGEITNLPYLQKIGSSGKPIILSTGMSTLGEIESALLVLETTGAKRGEITVLHCNTEYPTPYSDVNLSAMKSIADAFKIKVGYSDHTSGIEISIAAVALGASVIEKHFTLDRSLPGPDHKASLEPNELKGMVRSIRNVELSLGDGIKKPSSSEFKNISIARKSIVAASSIKAGEIFTRENLTAKRPGDGISPMRLNEVIGLKAKREFFEDELIDL